MGSQTQDGEGVLLCHLSWGNHDSFSENQYTKEEYALNKNKFISPKDSTKKVSEINGSGTESKDTKNLSMHLAASKKRKPLVLAGRLRIPNMASQDEASTGSRMPEEVHRGNEKTCKVCHDKNDWIPLGRHTEDLTSKPTVEKDESSLGNHSINVGQIENIE